MSGKEDELCTDSAPTINDPFTTHDYMGCIEDFEGIDPGKDASKLGNQERSKYAQEKSSDELQYEEFNSNKRVCDVTFTINCSKASPFSAYPRLSSIYKKPVSVVQPLTSSGAKLPSDTSFSGEDELDGDNSNGDCSLAQVVLHSRDRIALALSMVSDEEQENFPQGTTSKNALSQGTLGTLTERTSSPGPFSRTFSLKGTSSQNVSLKSTFSKNSPETPIFPGGRKSKVLIQNGKHSKPTFQNGVESCSTMTGSEESYLQTSDSSFEKRTNDAAATSCKLNEVLDHERSKILASSERHQLRFSEEKSYSTPRRRSLKILPPSSGEKLKCSVKLEGVYLKDSFLSASLAQQPNSRSTSHHTLRVPDKDTVVVSPCSSVKESRASQEPLRRSHRKIVTNSEKGGCTSEDNANKKHPCSDRIVSPHCNVKSGYRTKKRLKDLVSSPKETLTSTSVVASGLRSKNSRFGSHAGKRLARKSSQTNKQDCLPSKKAKKDSPTPMKGRNRDNLHGERSSGPLRSQDTGKPLMKERDTYCLHRKEFHAYRAELLSSIKRNVPASRESSPEPFLFPCKGRGTCNKEFCFECC